LAFGVRERECCCAAALTSSEACSGRVMQEPGRSPDSSPRHRLIARRPRACKLSPMKALLIVCSLLGLVAACKDAAARPDPQHFLGLGIQNSFAPMDGVYCSGQPNQEQFAKLKNAGVVRVVSLRLPTEKETGWEEAKAKELGLEFVRIPVDGEAGLTVDNATLMAKQLAGASGPVLVMCNTSNRVGALFALKARFLDGKTAEEAIAVGKSCGLAKAEPAVTKMVSK